MGAFQELLQSQAGADAMKFDGVRPETIVIFEKASDHGEGVRARAGGDAAHARRAKSGITAMTAHDIEPGRRRAGEPGCRRAAWACARHVFAAHVRAEPGLVWAALTDPDQTAAYLFAWRGAR